MQGQAQPYAARTNLADREKPGFPGFIGDCLAFLIAALMALEITVIGRLFVGELLCVALAPLAVMQRPHLLYRKWPVMIIALGAVWLVAQMMSDILNASAFSDWTRGWLRIVFLVANFITLYVLIYNDYRRLLLFLAGVMIYRIAYTILDPALGLGFESWKWGYNIGFTVFILGACALIRPVGLALVTGAGAAVMLAFVNLGAQFRSMAGVLIVGAAVLGVQFLAGRMAGRGIKIRLNLPVLLMAGLLTLGGGWAAFALYGQLAASGTLGQAAQDKFYIQAESEHGLFLAGRTEILVSSRAIAERPLLGHGSWAEDERYDDLYLQLRGHTDRIFNQFEPDDPLIPSHSYLFGAWVEAGVAGGIFWAVIMSLVVITLLRFIMVRDARAPVLVFVMVLMLWDILFSPLGAHKRLLVAAWLVSTLMARDIILGYAPDWGRHSIAGPVFANYRQQVRQPPS